MEDLIKKESISLKAEIELLEILPYTNAFTGNIISGGFMQMKSYVEYSLILKMLSEKREKLKQLIKNNNDNKKS